MKSKQCFEVPFPVAFILIISVVTATFWPSLDGDFVFDDTEAIVNNADVLPTTPLWQVFQNDFWGRSVASNSSHKSYRPLTVLTFRFNYWLNGLHPKGFHVVNLCLHAAVCGLLLFIFNIICTGAITSWVSCTSLYATLMFAVHPVHTENVAGIVGRADILCAFFFFLTVFVYSRLCTITTESWISVNTLKILSLLLICTCLTGISMLSKEQGLTVLGFCILYDVILICGCKEQLIQYKLVSKNTLKTFIIRTSVSTVSGIALLGLRFWVMGGNVPVFQERDNPASFLPSWILRVKNYQYLYCMNVWLMIHPQWLCFDWSMGCIPLITTWTDRRLLAVVLFWIIFGVVLFCSIHKWKDPERRQLQLSIAMLVIPFLPASNLVVRVGFVVAERVLYISSAGFCLFVSLGLKNLHSSVKHSNCIIFLAGVCLAVFALRSYQRSKDWQTEKQLFQSALNVCPLNAKVHYNIAKNAADSGDHATAVVKYQEAIRLYANYDQAMNNLANIFKDQGNLQEAEHLLLKAVSLRPDFAAAWMNLGIVQSQLHHLKDAEQSYLKAIVHRHHYPDCYYNLGNLYLEQKKYNAAYSAWQEAVGMKPKLVLAWNNMIIMLDNIGELHKAKAIGTEALEYLPQEASIHFNLANVLGKLNEFHESEKHFLIATELYKDNPSYFTNLGVLYHRWKRYSEAREAYLHALKIDPSAQSAKENLKLLNKVYVS